MKIVLYTRAGCHLCEDALALLRAHKQTPKVIDIDTHPELWAEYHECVPVVLVDGKVRFRGRINPVLLKRVLRET